MPGITLKSSDHRPWSDTFRKYAEWNHRDGADLFIDQTRKLAVELYTQTAAIAPTQSEIAADVKKQGWKIPKFFSDGRMGRGEPRMWADLALSKREKRKRGRPTKGEQAERDAFKAKRPTLAQMQAFVIAVRARARLYLASGWLGAIADLGGSLNAGSGEVKTERGGAEIRRSETSVEITLWNRTPGIETMDAKKQFVAKAIAVRSADMLVYIRRKMDEAAAHFLKAA